MGFVIKQEDGNAENNEDHIISSSAVYDIDRIVRVRAGDA